MKDGDDRLTDAGVRQFTTPPRSDEVITADNPCRKRERRARV